jgi:hypothetical protein
MSAVWLVLDMDDGVLGAFKTRKEAVDEFAWGRVLKRHCYSPGAYEYITGYDDSDCVDFFVERSDVAVNNGWPVAEWVAAGRPMGRLADSIVHVTSDTLCSSGGTA